MSDSEKTKPRRGLGHRDMPPSKAALTRSEILDAAIEYLEHSPFRDLSVGRLMSETKYSRATFYLYFNDLHGLMETLLEEIKEGIVDGANAWLSNEGEPISGLQESVNAMVEVGYEQGTILKAISDAAPGDARLERAWQAFLVSFDEVVAARIEYDQAAGITPEFDPLPVARALNRMDAGTLIHAFGSTPKADKGAVCAAMTRLWVSTLYPFDVERALKDIKQNE